MSRVRWSRSSACALGLLIAAGPVAAAEPSSGSASQPGRLAASAQRQVQARPASLAQQAAAPTGGETRFLQSRRGRIVIALMVVATGYVVYSKFHDRVESPAS